jgi:hypothetical protein
LLQDFDFRVSSWITNHMSVAKPLQMKFDCFNLFNALLCISIFIHLWFKYLKWQQSLICFNRTRILLVAYETIIIQYSYQWWMNFFILWCSANVRSNIYSIRITIMRNGHYMYADVSNFPMTEHVRNVKKQPPYVIKYNCNIWWKFQMFRRWWGR